jgi:hypothetical protein
MLKVAILGLFSLQLSTLLILSRQQLSIKTFQIILFCLKYLNLGQLLQFLVAMNMANGYKTVRAQSSDGEIHFVFIKLELDDAFNDRNELDEFKIREIMKKEAQKPLNLLREYE